MISNFKASILYKDQRIQRVYCYMHLNATMAFPYNEKCIFTQIQHVAFIVEYLFQFYTLYSYLLFSCCVLFFLTMKQFGTAVFKSAI